MEQLLHYVWKHKILPLETLYTTDGCPVDVIDTGLHNPNAGPDFFNAKLRIDGTLWVGNVEIHTLASDWYRHAHHKDKAYDSVILHVVHTVDCEVTRTDGEKIPQLKLVCPEQVRIHYSELVTGDITPSCYSILPFLPKITVHSWLTALQTERLQQKTEQIKARLERGNQNWEDAFFITLARNFGMGLNGDAFERWASRIPLRCVDKIRDDLMRIEAFFFGMAGLLTDNSGDAYYLQLKHEFAYLQHLYSLPEPMDASLWRFLRTRPRNFPHIRIAQMAHLYYKVCSLFSKILEADSLDKIRCLLSTSTSPYWETHLIFGKESPKRMKTIGQGTQNLFVINTVVPFLFAYGRHKCNEELCNRAFALLDKLPAENNYITRMWGNVGLIVKSAAYTQAIIQLQREYCDKKKCLYCRFGYEYLRVK